MQTTEQEPTRNDASDDAPRERAPEPQPIFFTRRRRRASGFGTWVDGTVGDYKFQALVFAEHADDPRWELGDSRISKLWVAHRTTGKVVYNWDRGPDVEAVDAEVRRVVEALCGAVSTSASTLF